MGYLRTQCGRGIQVSRSPVAPGRALCGSDNEPHTRDHVLTALTLPCLLPRFYFKSPYSGKLAIILTWMLSLYIELY